MNSGRALTALALALVAAAAVTLGDAAPRVARPGPVGAGRTLLPNGWTIAPAGRHVQVGDLPLAMVESPDRRFLLVANNGYARPSISIVDARRQYVVGSMSLDDAWLGLAWHPDGRRLFVSGAAANSVHELTWDAGRLTARRDIALGAPAAPGQVSPRSSNRDSPNLIAGLSLGRDGRRLFAVDVVAQKVLAIDVDSGRVVASADLPSEPYTCLVSPDGRTLFVSLWGGAKVLMFDTETLQPRGEAAVGQHPNAMAVTADGQRLFVACANTNAVWAVDVADRRGREQISVALYPKAPPGATPNHVSLSPDGRTLLVALADNNAVAVVDVSRAGHSEVSGFIPTGWYPTAAAFSSDQSQVFVLEGKGLSSSPNPRFMMRTDLPGSASQYVGALLTGTLSFVPSPDAAALQRFTRTVYQVTRYQDVNRDAPAAPPAASPIPRRVGAASPIKHVFYVIRENRSYDQVLGDLGRGNGDPSLTLFGEDVTPNAHALAREFGVLDSFFVDAEVSYDGHAFSTAAYATDAVEKLWPTNYGGRGFKYISEGGGANRNEYGNLSAPQNGYLWDACVRAGVTVRSYGEFAAFDAQRRAVASVPGLEGRVAPEYAPYDLSIPDQHRVDAWLKEFAAFEANGNLPALSIIRLGNDHTQATTPGRPTPRAMVAENDLALGRLVEAISHSRDWPRSAIFVVEDDAQNGPDHVDAHRSVALAISPFSRRRTVDSTLYTTSGILRTIELILGLPPMSQYDAAAAPLYRAFQATPVASPFTHLPARVPLDERNDWRAYGARRALQYDFADADRVPDDVMNDLLWHAIKGAATPLPPIVRTAWVRSR